MEFAKDLLAGLRGRVRGAGTGHASTGLDWRGLHARMAAAHAARREISALPLRPVLAGGFDAWRSLAGSGKDLPVVNPTDLADGKIPAGNDGVTAADPVAGGRG